MTDMPDLSLIFVNVIWSKGNDLWTDANGIISLKINE